MCCYLWLRVSLVARLGALVCLGYVGLIRDCCGRKWK